MVRTKLEPGKTDLATLWPDIAAEAVGWDTTAFTPGSKKRQKWKCKKGHIYEVEISYRTGPSKQGCPYCSGNKVLNGFNDFATLFPEQAQEAHGWDPTEYSYGSKQKKEWKCKLGHVWAAVIYSRKHRSCPFCSGNSVLAGFNDLKTFSPEIASTAYEWDPSTVTHGSNKKMKWICKLGHVYVKSVKERKKHECPYCDGKTVLKGFNDLQSKRPEIAKGAHGGWNPAEYTYGSKKRVEWICNLGHIYSSTINSRTSRGDEEGCPFCAGRSVLEGFNDLASIFPEIAKEADGWDPASVTAGARKKAKWICSEGHRWVAAVSNRTPPQSSGCPECCEKGFNPGKKAWFYLMQRPGEQQFGITNNLEQRIRDHTRFGWYEIDNAGPFDGSKVLATENKLKTWLRTNVGLLEGSTENWRTTRMEFQSLRELFDYAEIEPLFPLTGHGNT